MPSWVGTATQRVAVGLARTKRTNDCTPGRSRDHHPSACYHLPATDGDMHRQTVSSMQQIADIKITWVPRRANAEADALASTPPGPRGPSRNLQSTSSKQPSARIARSVRSAPQPLRSTSRPLPPRSGTQAAALVRERELRDI